MLHPEMSGADDLETALAGPLAADDHASVPLPAPASSNLPLKNGSQRAAFIIHFPPFSIFPLFFFFPQRRRSSGFFLQLPRLTVDSSLCLVSPPCRRWVETDVVAGRGPASSD